MTSFCGCEQEQVQPINIVRQSTSRLSLAILGLAQTLSPVDPQCRLPFFSVSRLDLLGCWGTLQLSYTSVAFVPHSTV
jgi:hypothetical protein